MPIDERKRTQYRARVGREMFAPKDETGPNNSRKERRSSARCRRSKGRWRRYVCPLRAMPFDLMKTHTITRSLAGVLAIYTPAAMFTLLPCTSNARGHGGGAFEGRSFTSMPAGRVFEARPESRSFAAGNSVHEVARSHVEGRSARLDDRFSNSKFSEDRSSREHFIRARNRLSEFLDFGTPVWLVDSWADALSQDEIVDGMPSDLVLDCWGTPLFVERIMRDGRPGEVWTFHPRSGRTTKVTVFNHRVVGVRRIS